MDTHFCFIIDQYKPATLVTLLEELVMNIISIVLIAALGILHLGIMGLEMFASPATQSQSFDMPLDFVRKPEAQTALKNQGIYNGMLGVLLLLSLFVLSGSGQIITARLLSAFVLVVGIYGGLTATRKILLIQALPGLLTLISLFF
jgi:putative membrane protein